LKRRRDSTELLGAILSAYRNEITMTQAIYLTNTNYALMRRHLDPLVRYGYIGAGSSGRMKHRCLTENGMRLLGVIRELDKVMKSLRGLSDRDGKCSTVTNVPFTNGPNGYFRSSETPGRSRKFTQGLSPTTYSELQRIAAVRGTTVQALLRSVIVPVWLEENHREMVGSRTASSLNNFGPKKIPTWSTNTN
jgi:predicted transcriptional regulator